VLVEVEVSAVTTMPYLLEALEAGETVVEGTLEIVQLKHQLTVQ
jgi:hypothetical protein